MEETLSRKEKAEKIVKNHILWSMGAGAVPVPLMDIAGVTAIQIDMLKQLCGVYGVAYDENKGKSIITALAGGLGARFGASLIKSIPGVGSVLGGISMAGLSGASTYAIGQVFINNFEKGYMIGDINADDNKNLFKEAYERGKEIVKDLETKLKNESKDSENKSNKGKKSEDFEE